MTQIDEYRIEGKKVRLCTKCAEDRVYDLYMLRAELLDTDVKGACDTCDTYQERTFKYVGKPTGTRGEYGVNVTGGHTLPKDPEAIFITDPDFGQILWSSVEAALRSEDWIEIN